MNATLLEKLRKVLALTTSPAEGEAAAASAMLARLLKQHNLDITDLEERGQAKPPVGEDKVDLGKAAWQWKLDLAATLAEHYYCVAILRGKTPAFVGRPDNVQSLKMLYSWLIDQINCIAREERRSHAQKTGEHVDPLRWNLHFGLGVVSRLVERLAEIRRQEQDAAGTALVVSHATEANDYLEKHYGFRHDGQKTQAEKAADARWAEWEAKWALQADQKNELRDRCSKEGDMEPFYKVYPEDRPETPRADGRSPEEGSQGAQGA